MIKNFKIQQLFLLILSIAFGSVDLSAQLSGDELKEISDDIFIQNAFIKTAPGETVFQGDVYISKGVIIEVGVDLQKRPEAKLIKGDSLYLYAAFINALSQAGLPDEPDDARRSAWRGAPGLTPLNQSGIAPQNHIRDDFELRERDVKGFHREGFGLIHVVPKGFVMAGKGSVFPIQPNQSAPSDLIKEETGLFAQFRNMRRVYPSTPLATMSVWRQIFKDLESQKYYYEKWIEQPEGLEKAQISNEYRSLFPVANRQQSVFFRALENKEVLRAQRLSSELEIDLIFCHTTVISPEIWKHLPENSRFLVNLDFPEHPHDKVSKTEEEEEEEEEEEDPKDEEKEGDAQEPESKKSEESDLDTLPPGMTEQEFELLVKSRTEAYENIMNFPAGLLQKNSLAGFSFLDIEPGKSLAQLRKLLNYGMDEDDLLAALTTLPAEALGLNRIYATVEKGKQAYLVLFDRPFTEKEAKVKFLLLNGKIYEYNNSKD
jgi:hypothetical protein